MIQPPASILSLTVGATSINEWDLTTQTYDPVVSAVEAVTDAAEHASAEFPTRDLRDKMVIVRATEVVTSGVPGTLNMWIELSPFLSTTDASYWAAIGGGGGAQAPIAPVLESGVGTDGLVHTILLPWSVHSEFARLVIQTPSPVSTATWSVQAYVMGKS